MKIYDNGLHKLRSATSYTDHNCIEVDLKVSLSPIPIERRTAWRINNHTEWERFRAELQEVVDLYSSTVGETNQDKSNDIDSKYTTIN